MPAQLVLKWCLCNICTAKGGTDVDGKLKGVLMKAHLIPAHLKCLQHKQTLSYTSNDHAHRSSTNLQSNNGTFSSATDFVARHFFALTLMDDGPNTKSIPNKLWSSHAEFQDSGPSNVMIADPPGPSSVPIADLAKSLSRLTIQSSPPMDLSLSNSVLPVTCTKSVGCKTMYISCVLQDI